MNFVTSGVSPEKEVARIIRKAASRRERRRDFKFLMFGTLLGFTLCALAVVSVNVVW